MIRINNDPAPAHAELGRDHAIEIGLMNTSLSSDRQGADVRPHIIEGQSPHGTRIVRFIVLILWYAKKELGDGRSVHYGIFPLDGAHL